MDDDRKENAPVENDPYAVKHSDSDILPSNRMR